MMKATKKCAKILNSEGSFLYLALSILSESGFPYISALMAIIGPSNFLKMVRLFSGTTFRMPTTMELGISIYSALYLYHKYVEPMDENNFFKAYEVPKDFRLGIKTRVKQYEKYMKQQKIDLRVMLNKVVDF